MGSLAQTFLIDDSGGVFVSSVDLFFSTKDDNIPITVQIREVVNGYPGTKILPFSEKTINPSAVTCKYRFNNGHNIYF